jgi:DNA-binding CsgD family transcriptional regulator
MALTERQRQVVAGLAGGLRYRELAAELGISSRQVQRHVADAAERLGAANANELIALAIVTGAVPRPPRR